MVVGEGGGRGYAVPQRSARTKLHSEYIHPLKDADFSHSLSASDVFPSALRTLLCLNMDSASLLR